MPNNQELIYINRLYNFIKNSDFSKDPKYQKIPYLNPNLSEDERFNSFYINIKSNKAGLRKFLAQKGIDINNIKPFTNTEEVATDLYLQSNSLSKTGKGQFSDHFDNLLSPLNIDDKDKEKIKEKSWEIKSISAKKDLIYDREIKRAKKYIDDPLNALTESISKGAAQFITNHGFYDEEDIPIHLSQADIYEAVKLKNERLNEMINNYEKDENLDKKEKNKRISFLKKDIENNKKVLSGYKGIEKLLAWEDSLLPTLSGSIFFMGEVLATSGLSTALYPAKILNYVRNLKRGQAIASGALHALEIGGIASLGKLTSLINNPIETDPDFGDSKAKDLSYLHQQLISNTEPDERRDAIYQILKTGQKVVETGANMFMEILSEALLPEVKTAKTLSKTVAKFVTLGVGTEVGTEQITDIYSDITGQSKNTSIFTALFNDIFTKEKVDYKTAIDQLGIEAFVGLFLGGIGTSISYKTEKTLDKNSQEILKIIFGSDKVENALLTNKVTNRILENKNYRIPFLLAKTDVTEKEINEKLKKLNSEKEEYNYSQAELLVKLDKMFGEENVNQKNILNEPNFIFLSLLDTLGSNKLYDYEVERKKIEEQYPESSEDKTKIYSELLDKIYPNVTYSVKDILKDKLSSTRDIDTFENVEESFYRIFVNNEDMNPAKYESEYGVVPYTKLDDYIVSQLTKKSTKEETLNEVRETLYKNILLQRGFYIKEALKKTEEKKSSPLDKKNLNTNSSNKNSLNKNLSNENPPNLTEEKISPEKDKEQTIHSTEKKIVSVTPKSGGKREYQKKQEYESSKKSIENEKNDNQTSITSDTISDTTSKKPSEKITPEEVVFEDTDSKIPTEPLSKDKTSEELIPEEEINPEEVIPQDIESSSKETESEKITPEKSQFEETKSKEIIPEKTQKESQRSKEDAILKEMENVLDIEGKYTDNDLEEYSVEKIDSDSGTITFKVTNSLNEISYYDKIRVQEFLKDKIKTGELDNLSSLEEFIKEYDIKIPKILQFVLQKHPNLMKQLHVKFDPLIKFHGKVVSGYYYNKTIYINKNVKPRNIEKVFNHELTHALLSGIIKLNVQAFNKINALRKKFITELGSNSLKITTSGILDKNEENAVHEFLAHVFANSLSSKINKIFRSMIIDEKDELPVPFLIRIARKIGNIFNINSASLQNELEAIIMENIDINGDIIIDEGGHALLTEEVEELLSEANVNSKIIEPLETESSIQSLGGIRSIQKLLTDFATFIPDINITVSDDPYEVVIKALFGNEAFNNIAEQSVKEYFTKLGTLDKVYYQNNKVFSLIIKHLLMPLDEINKIPNKEFQENIKKWQKIAYKTYDKKSSYLKTYKMFLNNYLKRIFNDIISIVKVPRLIYDVTQNKIIENNSFMFLNEKGVPQYSYMNKMEIQKKYKNAIAKFFDDNYDESDIEILLLNYYKLNEDVSYQSNSVEFTTIYNHEYLNKLANKGYFLPIISGDKNNIIVIKVKNFDKQSFDNRLEVIKRYYLIDNKTINPNVVLSTYLQDIKLLRYFNNKNSNVQVERNMADMLKNPHRNPAIFKQENRMANFISIAKRATLVKEMDNYEQPEQDLNKILAQYDIPTQIQLPTYDKSPIFYITVPDGKKGYKSILVARAVFINDSSWGKLPNGKTYFDGQSYILAKKGNGLNYADFLRTAMNYIYKGAFKVWTKGQIYYYTKDLVYGIASLKPSNFEIMLKHSINELFEDKNSNSPDEISNLLAKNEILFVFPVSNEKNGVLNYINNGSFIVNKSDKDISDKVVLIPLFEDTSTDKEVGKEKTTIKGLKQFNFTKGLFINNPLIGKTAKSLHELVTKIVKNIAEDLSTKLNEYGSHPNFGREAIEKVTIEERYNLVDLIEKMYNLSQNTDGITTDNYINGIMKIPGISVFFNNKILSQLNRKIELNLAGQSLVLTSALPYQYKESIFRAVKNSFWDLLDFFNPEDKEILDKALGRTNYDTAIIAGYRKYRMLIREKAMYSSIFSDPDSTRKKRNESIRKIKEINKKLKFYEKYKYISLEIDKTIINEYVKNKYFDKDGFIKMPYVIVPSSFAVSKGVMVGDELLVTINPMTALNQGFGVKVIGIVDDVGAKQSVSKGSMYINPAFIQAHGRDYDIDVLQVFVRPVNYIDLEDWKTLIKNTQEMNISYINETYDYLVETNFINEDTQKQINEFQGNEWELATQKLLVIKNSELMIKYMQKLFGNAYLRESEVQVNEQSSLTMATKFEKEVGQAVMGQMYLTLLGGMNISIKKTDDQKIDYIPAYSDNDYKRLFTMLEYLTNHLVDMPSDTSLFNYNYSEEKLYNLIYQPIIDKYNTYKGNNSPIGVFAVKKFFSVILNPFISIMRAESENFESFILNLIKATTIIRLLENKDINALKVFIDRESPYLFTKNPELRDFLKIVSFGELKSGILINFVNSIDINKIYSYLSGLTTGQTKSVLNAIREEMNTLDTTGFDSNKLLAKTIGDIIKTIVRPNSGRAVETQTGNLLRRKNIVEKINPIGLQLLLDYALTNNIVSPEPKNNLDTFGIKTKNGFTLFLTNVKSQPSIVVYHEGVNFLKSYPISEIKTSLTDITELEDVFDTKDKLMGVTIYDLLISSIYGNDIIEPEFDNSNREISTYPIMKYDKIKIVPFYEKWYAPVVKGGHFVKYNMRSYRATEVKEGTLPKFTIQDVSRLMIIDFFGLRNVRKEKNMIHENARINLVNKFLISMNEIIKRKNVTSKLITKEMLVRLDALVKNATSNIEDNKYINEIIEEFRQANIKIAESNYIPQETFNARNNFVKYLLLQNFTEEGGIYRDTPLSQPYLSLPEIQKNVQKIKENKISFRMPLQISYIMIQNFKDLITYLPVENLSEEDAIFRDFVLDKIVTEITNVSPPTSNEITKHEGLTYLEEDTEEIFSNKLRQIANRLQKRFGINYEIIKSKDLKLFKDVNYQLFPAYFNRETLGKDNFYIVNDEGEAKEIIIGNIEELYSKIVHVNKSDNLSVYHLKELYDNPTLYQHFPELAYLKVKFENKVMKQDYQAILGTASMKDFTITIYSKGQDLVTQVGTLVHEIQHILDTYLGIEAAVNTSYTILYAKLAYKYSKEIANKAKNMIDRISLLEHLVLLSYSYELKQGKKVRIKDIKVKGDYSQFVTQNIDNEYVIIDRKALIEETNQILQELEELGKEYDFNYKLIDNNIMTAKGLLDDMTYKYYRKQLQEKNARAISEVVRDILLNKLVKYNPGIIDYVKIANELTSDNDFLFLNKYKFYNKEKGLPFLIYKIYKTKEQNESLNVLLETLMRKNNNLKTKEEALEFALNRVQTFIKENKLSNTSPNAVMTEYLKLHEDIGSVLYPVKVKKTLYEQRKNEYLKSLPIPDEIIGIITNVLTQYKELENYHEYFYTPEGVILVAAAIDNSVKSIEYSSLTDKDILLNYIVTNLPHWYEGDILHVTTTFGKFKFNTKGNDPEIRLTTYLDDLIHSYQKIFGIPAGYFDGEKAYLIEDLADETTPIHEMFSHPFLLQIEENNPELYNSLLQEVLKNQIIVNEVNTLYQGSDNKKLEHEYIARAIDIYLNKERTFTKELIDKIIAFFKYMSLELKKMFGINISVEDINSKKSIKDIVNLVRDTNLEIDLSTKEKETDIFESDILKEITYKDEKNNNCASEGLTNSEGYDEWHIEEEFLFIPFHSKGGHYIDINNQLIQVEQNEILLKSSKGYFAIIPNKYLLEVKGMIQDGCWKCLNSFINTLPKLRGYYDM